MKDWVLILSGYEVLWLVLGCGLLGGVAGLVTSWLMPIRVAQLRGKRRGAHRPWWHKAPPVTEAAPPAVTVAIPVLDAETERIPKVSIAKGKT